MCSSELSLARSPPVPCRDGIEQHGIVSTEDGVLVYAYEVDGRGNSLADTDDPNVPSLLAAPLLGYSPLDAAIHAATRARLLSVAENPFYFASAWPINDTMCMCLL
jgi:uncharacterized protein